MRNGPFALNRLANRARFSRTSAMRIIYPLFHRRIFSFFYIKLRNLLLSFRRAHPISHSFTTPFHPLKSYFYHANYLLTHSRFSSDICYAVGSSYHNRVVTVFARDFKLVQSAHNDVLVCSFAYVYDVYCSQHEISVASTDKSRLSAGKSWKSTAES